MADGREYAILSAIRGRLSGITVAGGYSVDLDGPDQVVIASLPVTIERVPAVYVAFVSASASHGRTLGNYLGTLQVAIVGIGAASGEGTEARARAALALLSDIRRRLEGDRSLGGEADDLIVRYVADISGDDPDLAHDVCAVTMTVEVTYQRLTEGV